jgi:hypothetical protein
MKGTRLMRKLAVVALLAMACSASAGTIGTWKTAAVGLWSNGANWSAGTVPPTGSTSTTDEIKITGAGGDATVDYGVDCGVAKVSVAGNNDATAPVLRVVTGANLATGELRAGSKGTTSGGSRGLIVQTDGIVSVTDLKLGLYGTSGTGIADGYYTISGGTLQGKTSGSDRLYVGAGLATGSTKDNTTGRFTVVGNLATISMKMLYVGSDGTNAGTGTLEFQVSPSGVSHVQTTGNSGVILDAGGANSVANLVVSLISTVPAADILLVKNIGTGAVSGAFDSLNGGTAAEGASVTLGGNTYTLTYQYNGGDGIANDIALVFQGSAVEQPASAPVPADGATVDTTLALLDWTNPAPAIAGNPVYCDVYLGTVADRLSMEKVTLPDDISQVDINPANFPTYGSLQNQTTYYWVVDVHDAGSVRSGATWSFLTSHIEAPTANAGPDQVVWLGKSGVTGHETIALDGTTSSGSAYTVLWTQVSNGAPTVTITPNNVDDTSVTVTARGTYEFRLIADNGIQTSDTVQVIVGATSCDASHMSTGAAYSAMDQNHDCIVNMADFAVLIVSDWLGCTDRLTNCGN